MLSKPRRDRLRARCRLDRAEALGRLAEARGALERATAELAVQEARCRSLGDALLARPRIGELLAGALQSEALDRQRKEARLQACLARRADLDREVLKARDALHEAEDRVAEAQRALDRLSGKP